VAFVSILLQLKMLYKQHNLSSFKLHYNLNELEIKRYISTHCANISEHINKTDRYLVEVVLWPRQHNTKICGDMEITLQALRLTSVFQYPLTL
jgi:hypothetical protein